MSGYDIVHGLVERKPVNRQTLVDLSKQAFKIGTNTMQVLLHRGREPDWKRLILSAESIFVERNLVSVIPSALVAASLITNVSVTLA